jgi:MFS family permease
LRDNLSTESNILYYGWVVVSMAFLANLVGYGLVYTFGIFLKPLSIEFGWSRSEITKAFLFYGILHNLLGLITARLCDRFGPKLVLAIAGFCFGLSMVLMNYVTTIGELYVYYGVLLSIGIASAYIPVTSTVSQWFRVKRGFAIGLSAAGLGAGSLVFSPLSAWLISSLGWRRAYTIFGIFAWVAFIPIVKFIKRVPHESMGLGGLEGFSFFEAFRTRTFWVFSLSWFFIAFTWWSVMIHIYPLATDRGMPMITAGILVGLIGGTSIIGRISAGFLSDKVGRKRVLITEFSVLLIAFIWLLFSTKEWMLFFFAILFGISSGGWTGIIAAFPADYFGYKATSSILSFMVLIAGIGQAIGPWLGGYIFDTTQSYNYMVILCILANIAAIISASLIRPPRFRSIVVSDRP